MNNKFYAVMVICDRDINESKSFSCLKKLGFDKLVVCDNSTQPNDNAECGGADVHYISMGENAGLSRAYNRAIDYLSAEQGYICIFDDDTQLPDDYIEKLDETAEKEKPDIILPTVYDEVGIMSPCRINGVLTSRIESADELTEDNISGINSGMAIRAEIFSSYRYDENLFLDFIDHDFLRDMKKLGRKIAVCDGLKIRQSFSANDRDIARARKRFAIFKKDYTAFCRKSGRLADRISGRLYLMKRSININVLYRLGK